MLLQSKFLHSLFSLASHRMRTQKAHIKSQQVEMSLLLWKQCEQFAARNTISTQYILKECFPTTCSTHTQPCNPFSPRHMHILCLACRLYGKKCSTILYLLFSGTSTALLAHNNASKFIFSHIIIYACFCVYAAAAAWHNTSLLVFPCT